MNLFHSFCESLYNHTVRDAKIRVFLFENCEQNHMHDSRITRIMYSTYDALKLLYTRGKIEKMRLVSPNLEREK